MKNRILISLLLISFFSRAQLYTDNFDASINSTGTPPAGFTINIVDENLQITGDGSGAMWASMDYNMHNNGSSTLVDISSSTKLYIKARASVPLEFRIDLRDETGYVTNQNATSVNLSNNYQVYEFDYTGKLFDGAYGGPCTTGPCNVDPAKIAGLSMFAKPGVGGYNGVIDIDWISLGSAIEGSVPKHSIRLNRVGYLTGREKIISINSSEDINGLNYSVKDASGATIKSGITGATEFWDDAQEYVTHIDISDIETEGDYIIEVEEVIESFTIGSTIYDELADAVFKYFYFNRSSTEITAPYVENVYARASGTPDTNVLVHWSAASAGRPEGTLISSEKGWYDAGDYNKYIVNSGISTYTLLAAFERYSDYYSNKDFNIPESGNTIPDILDEALWNIEWMLTMQDPDDGGVYHKLTGINLSGSDFSGIIMPEDYNIQRYVVAKSTAAALNFAAVMATASRIFADFESQKPGLSNQLIQAAESAYAWAKANPTNYFTNPTKVQGGTEKVITGEYGDGNVNDEFRWAATELFITTGNNTYSSDINIAANGAGVPAWPNVDALGLYSIMANASSLNSSLDISTVETKLLNTASTIRDRINTSAMRIGMATNDYVWGSNGTAGNQLLYLLKAYEISNDDSYLNAAFTGMDYLLGRNAIGTSFITGFRLIATMNPHHRISEADTVTEPVPGMVAGGPQPGQQDGCSYPSSLPAKSYSDTWCSYASNEVTINWNAPLVYVVNALRFYQNSGVLSVNEETIKTNDEIAIYPNPTNDEFYVKGLDSETSSITLFSILGKKILTITNTLKIDMSSLDSGLYLVQIIAGDKKIVRKIIRE